MFHYFRLFSMYTSEILGKGNQPQEWEITSAPHPLNESLHYTYAPKCKTKKGIVHYTGQHSNSKT